MQGGVLAGGCGGFISGSMSTISRELDDTTTTTTAMSSEDSSSPDDSELELGLGLSLGFNHHHHHQVVIKGNSCHNYDYPRILTAKDMPSSQYASSTTSSSSTLSRSSGNNNVGTKRSAADSLSAAQQNSASSQVVGWPPIRAYRMNSMVNQARSMATEEFNSMVGKSKGNNTLVENTKNGNNINSFSKARTSLFVKVNMDGIPIGRKVDLSSHGCYEALAQTLEDMFLRPAPTINAIRSSAPEHNIMVDGTRRPKLLDGSSDFVLTYEDKEGDWMLVGDVPWGMFLTSVKRLRIMRTSEATGLGK
ncbi:auxin-responsive protein IAA11 isoform X2 [Mercurialis annua]|uniref:auxin-responsive protein IAA11 isoform X2 n=1 Tax=Mercurialis annua TaxID=3986 RepID=UPI00215EDC8E|nr:auxin-responsive protein IAA11 isoform X2 [Mercurialis annua]